MEEVVTEGEWVSGDYGDFLGLSSEERAIVEQRAERARLEREVVEAATSMRNADRAAKNGATKSVRTQALFQYGEQSVRLSRACDSLIEFESNQQQIKK